MKQWIVCVVGVYALCGVFAFAEEPIKATTDSGKKVILYLDGTWKYIKNEIPSGSRKQVFSRTVQATEKAEFAGGKYILFFDSSKWQREESEEAGHLKWRHKNGDAYAQIISERIQIPIESLRKIAFSNAKQAAADIKITFEDKRQVNNREILCLQMKGTIQGVAFVYFGYYYSGTGGTVQILTFTGQNLFEEYQNDFEEFLNGFEVSG